MYFTHRPTQVKDVEACFAIFPQRHLYDAEARERLKALWRFLLEKDACVSVVVEDRRLPASRRQVAFGFTYFTDDEFVRRARTELPPNLTGQILRQWRGGRCPLLLRNEIKKAITGEGLNALLLHHGWDVERLSPEESFKAQSFLQECFLTYHGGYPLKELLQEVHGPEVRDIAAAAGERLRRDYREFMNSPLLQGVPEKDRPYLLGSTREEATQQQGSFLALLFSKMSRPHFRFNDGERKTLERALQGETDGGIAKSLKVSHWTIKKRWQAIYQKVTAVDAELLAKAPRAEEPGEGPERQKRRRLLDYLRVHPEEFRAGAVRSPRKL